MKLSLRLASFVSFLTLLAGAQTVACSADVSGNSFALDGGVDPSPWPSTVDAGARGLFSRTLNGAVSDAGANYCAVASDCFTTTPCGNPCGACEVRSRHDDIEACGATSAAKAGTSVANAVRVPPPPECLINSCAKVTALCVDYRCVLSSQLQF